MKNFKAAQILKLFIALTLSLSCFSCGGTSVGEAGETTIGGGASESGSEAVTEPVVTLPDKKYDGYEFRILTRLEGWGTFNNEHLVVEYENGEILNDSIYERNRRVEERFDVKLVEIVTKEKPIDTDIQKTAMSGDNSYDMYIPTIVPILGTEYLADLSSFGYISLDKPWWDHNFNTVYSINGKQCTAVGSLMITHMDATLAMFYNKRIADDYNLPDLYEIVRSGGWTVAKFFELTKGVASDLNGDGVYDDRDRFVFDGLDGILRVAGVDTSLVTKNEKDIPELNIGNSLLIDRISALRDYQKAHDDEFFDPRIDKNNGGDGDSAVFRVFANGQALFFTHGVGSAKMFRELKDDFGVIPVAKFDENQENYYVSTGFTKMIAVPANAPDVERTSAVIEAMSYEGYTYLKPKYYETMLQNKFLRDEESIEMLDEYVYTNIGYSLDGVFDSVRAARKSIIRSDEGIASTLAANKTKIEDDIAKFVELFK